MPCLPHNPDFSLLHFSNCSWIINFDRDFHYGLVHTLFLNFITGNTYLIVICRQWVETPFNTLHMPLTLAEQRSRNEGRVSTCVSLLPSVKSSLVISCECFRDWDQSLIMMTEIVFQTLGINSIIAWLIAWEDFIAAFCCECFKSYLLPRFRWISRIRSESLLPCWAFSSLASNEYEVII